MTSACKPTDQITVLKAVEARLLSLNDPRFTKENVRWTLDPDPPDITRSPNMVTVIRPAPGSWADPEQQGGGENVSIERSGVVITIYSRQISDQAGKANEVLFGQSDEQSRSLLKMKHAILKRLAGHMLLDPRDQGQLLVESILPMEAAVPFFDSAERQKQWAELSIGFAFAFEWDLTDDE